MSQPYIGEIRIMGNNFAPAGWALCDGAIMPISENDALFNLIGTTYGGDGQETFALPNLASRFPIHMGTGASLSTHVLGESAGTEEATLSVQQIPSHSHAPVASNTGGSDNPEGSFWAATATGKPYGNPPGADNMNAGTITGNGGSQPHDNMHPYLALTYIISLYGIYPSPS